MVFHSYALWPHMDVYQNIVFPLRRGLRRVGPDEMSRRVKRVTELLHLTEQLRRPVAQLSGGQQQRVALARALALEPAVLLMDEPLSNLDAKLRAQLRLEIKALTKAVGMTTLYVTHDQTEAMVMGDRIAVMAEGSASCRRASPPSSTSSRASCLLAKFLGDMNFLTGVMKGDAASRAELTTAMAPSCCRGCRMRRTPEKSVVGFRPEDAEVCRRDRREHLSGADHRAALLGRCIPLRCAVRIVPVPTAPAKPGTD